MREKLDSFISGLPIDKITTQLEMKYSIDKKLSSELIGIFSNEARVAFDLVEGFLAKDKRLLEIGSGLCVFSLFLKDEGFNIVALEPAMGGYSIFEIIKNEILRSYSDLNLEVLIIPADKLTKSEHGSFDVIFSSNVIEHIPNLEESFSAMTNVLDYGGVMLHVCPNYMFPYEPHFGIPIVKPFSNFFKMIFKIDTRINSDVWDSLNFITYFDVKRIAKNNNLRVKFKGKVLYNTLLRMDKDNFFYERHSGGVISKVYLFIKRINLLEVIKYFPITLSTPMVFSMEHEKDLDHKRLKE